MPSEVFNIFDNLLFRGPPVIKTQSGSNQFAGRIILNSGSLTVTVSTFVVNSDSLIFYNLEVNTDQTSPAAVVVVRSISSGNFFTFGTASGAAMQRDLTIMWNIFRASNP